MEIHFKIIGYVLIALAVVHVVFPKYFHWKTELAPLSLVNRQMMVVHTFFIALAVLLMGLLLVISAPLLLTNPLGKHILLGLAIFWSLRLLVQFFGYSPELWKGKTFETIIHVVFSIFWFYISFVFWWAYWV